MHGKPLVQLVHQATADDRARLSSGIKIDKYTFVECLVVPGKLPGVELPAVVAATTVLI